MDLKAIYDYCKNLGCCDLCCLRYMGIKCPNAYGNYKNYLAKYQNETKCEEEADDTKKSIDPEVINNLPKSETQVENTDTNSDNKTETSINQDINNDLSKEKSTIDENGGSNGLSPPCKKRKMNVCCSCLGVLQEENWQESCDMVKESLDRKRYESRSFACALSAPIATLLRERAITLRLEEKFSGYEHKNMTVLKEAWKWSYGIKLGTHIKKTLDSGAISPLLVTVNMDYADDIQELEILKSVSPQLFEERNKQKRRFATEFTRRSVEQALERASLASLAASAPGGAQAGLPRAAAPARAVSVVCVHSPAYLAGSSKNFPEAASLGDTAQDSDDDTDDENKPTIAEKANRLAVIKTRLAKELLKSSYLFNDESWNSPGRSQDPTVVPPDDSETGNPERKKKKNRKRKVDALSLYFIEAKEKARRNPAERRLLLQRYKAITLRLRAEELKLQAEWLNFMSESMSVINNIIAKKRNESNDDSDGDD